MKGLFLVFLCAVMLSSICIGVSAEEGAAVLPKEFDDFISSLPKNITDRLPDGFFASDADKLYESVSEMYRIEYILSAVSDALGVSVRGFLPLFAALCGVVILSALGNAVANGLSSSGGKIFGICARMCIFSATVSGAVVSISSIEEYFRNISEISAAFIPLSGVLYAMGGNINAAVASSSSTAVALSVCDLAITNTVMPFFCICLAFSVISSCQLGVDMSMPLGFIKKIYTSSLAFIMFLISGSIAAQTIIASRADGASMKGIKFFAGTLIPITGGVVSANLSSFAASVELIRSCVGIGGIAILLMLLLPLIIRLTVLKAIYSAVAFFAGMVGAIDEQRILSDISSLYGYLEGVAILSSVVTFISMALVVFCGSAVAA